MSQLIALKLKKITYAGDDIGSNFHITVKTQGSEVKFDERIEVGASKALDVNLFNQTVDQGTLSVQLDILEEDPIYDETATHQFLIPINNLSGLRTHSTSLTIDGQGWEKGRTATLTFDFEVSQDDGRRYVSDADDKGWLLIRPDWRDERTQLAFATRVKLTKIVEGREHFIIEEGVFKGKTGSVRKKRSGGSYLLNNYEHKAGAVLKFEKSSEILTIEGLGSYSAESKSDPISPGIHDIEIPTAPHVDQGRSYLRYSNYAQTWFRIGHSGDKFLHCGIRSLGCITVKEPEKWTDIYQFLIGCRKNDKSIGTVEVID